MNLSQRTGCPEIFQPSYITGHALLTYAAAGSYTFIFSTTPRPNRMIITGPHGFELDLSSAMIYRKTDQPSNLILERHFGTSFVRELYLADLGLHLRYDIPKAKDEKELAQGPASTEQFLIATAK
jgi:hypothetical protein